MVEDLIKFQPVEVISRVWFVCGQSKCFGCRITSIVLIPMTSSGSHIVMEISLPEIFLQ